jgi:hypothetical protein
MKNGGQRVARKWSHDNVHMIGHDAPREKAESFFVKVMQSFADRVGYLGVSQIAKASATIEVALDACRREVRDSLSLVRRKMPVKLTGGAEDVPLLELDFF